MTRLETRSAGVLAACILSIAAAPFGSFSRANDGAPATLRAGTEDVSPVRLVTGSPGAGTRVPAAATVPAGAACPTTLQSLVDSARPSAVIVLPPCIYRESVTIDKPLTLVGSAGTEIRGADVWTDWRPDGAAWRSAKSVPALESGGRCRGGTDACLGAEQVFVDGIAQSRVTTDPHAGQFALAPDRSVLLGSDPTGQTVEVTTRPRWLDVTASDVTVRQLTFRDAGNAPQSESGALRVSNGADRFTLAASKLFDAHGALLGIVGGSGHQVLDSELARGGEEGFAITRTEQTTIARTTIHDNNAASFDPGWEAGAGKATLVRGLTFEDDVVSANAGPGLWCDIDCESVVFRANRADHNEGPGIFFEISTGAQIASNVVFENGWGHADWGWGAGILVSSSGQVEVSGNTVAWNADGIAVISQDRPDRPASAGTGIDVHDNTIVGSRQPTDSGEAFLMAWLQDWNGPLYAAASNNRGSDNRYWSAASGSEADVFHWSNGIVDAGAFATTPVGQGDREMTIAERDAALQNANVPLHSEPHVISLSLKSELAELAPIAVAAALLAIAAVGGMVVVVRRRRGRGRSRA